MPRIFVASLFLFTLATPAHAGIASWTGNETEYAACSEVRFVDTNLAYATSVSRKADASYVVTFGTQGRSTSKFAYGDQFTVTTFGLDRSKVRVKASYDNRSWSIEVEFAGGPELARWLSTQSRAVVLRHSSGQTVSITVPPIGQGLELLRTCKPIPAAANREAKLKSELDYYGVSIRAKYTPEGRKNIPAGSYFRPTRFRLHVLKSGSVGQCAPNPGTRNPTLDGLICTAIIKSVTYTAATDGQGRQIESDVDLAIRELQF